MTVARAVELQEQSWTLEAEGKLDEASCACREALRLMECAEGRDSPDVANLLNDLAEIEQERQNFAEALALAKRAQSVEAALGEHFAGEQAARIRARRRTGARQDRHLLA
jgi:tetratricopeptide (TPR) repeat protein